MDIYLPAALEAWVHESVQSGRYESVDAVVHEALCLVEERDAGFNNRRAELRREIEIGLQQLERGQAKTYDDQSL
jgi:antitoxin ParD1/3/4